MSDVLYEVFSNITIVLLFFGGIFIALTLLWIKFLEDLGKSYERFINKINEYNKGE